MCLMSKEKISKIVEKKDRALDSFDWKKMVPLVLGVVLIGAGLFVAMNLPSGTDDVATPEETSDTQQKERTQYQQNYVDCPDEYLDVCTELSKLPTASVSFVKTDNQRICLQRQDNNNTMVAMMETVNGTNHLDYHIQLNANSCPF